MKKNILILLTLILSLGVLVGCKKEENKTISENNSWPRTIVDATGKEIVLNEKPKRISILHSAYLEHFILLNNPPTASAGSSIGNATKAVNEWETLKDFKLDEEIIDLGSAKQINLEAILNSKPDVIVTFKGSGQIDEVYDSLNKIAPVILLDYTKPWQEQLLECAEIVGEEEFAKNYIKETEEIIKNAKSVIEKSDKTYSIFRTNNKTFINTGDKKYYETFGLKAPKGYPEESRTTLSLETLYNMNPDIIVFQDYLDMTESFVDSLEKYSVWNELNAVKNNNVFYFDDSLNTFGPLALRHTAEKLLDIYS